MAARPEASHHKVRAERAYIRIYGVLAQRHRPLLESQQESTALLFRIIMGVILPKVGQSRNRVQSQCKV